MPIVIESIQFMRDDFSAELNWATDVVGLNVERINIQILGGGAPTAAMPSNIPVKLTSRVPNLHPGEATLPSSSPRTWNLPRIGADPQKAGRTRYRLSKSIAEAGGFLGLGDKPELTTVVRPFGTSDVEFRRALGWTMRGAGTQPMLTTAPTANESTDTPDCLRLLQAGGVEVLEAAVVPAKGWKVEQPAVRRLIRSPADIAYYSGHGLHDSSCLAIETPPGSHTYACWANAFDLTPHWRSPMDLDVFVIAGCSVLDIDRSTSPPSGPGLDWALLLSSKGGPIGTLLGYAGGAPSDAAAATPIARELAARIADGSGALVKDWLEINAAHKAWNAVALDSRGYWWLELERALGFLWSNGFRIRGPEPIP
jgi:hypothetical protein